MTWSQLLLGGNKHVIHVQNVYVNKHVITWSELWCICACVKFHRLMLIYRKITVMSWCECENVEKQNKK